MTDAELREAEKRIRQDPNTVEILYNKKMIDEFGMQSLLIKKQYVLGTECIEIVYAYEGNTTNYKMTGSTINYLINDAEIEIIPDVKVTAEPEYQEIVFTEDSVIMPLNLGGYEGTPEEIQSLAFSRSLDELMQRKKQIRR